MHSTPCYTLSRSNIDLAICLSVIRVCRLYVHVYWTETEEESKGAQELASATETLDRSSFPWLPSFGPMKQKTLSLGYRC